MKRGEPEPLLSPSFTIPEFDVKLCAAIYSCIEEKTALDEFRARELARRITIALDFLTSAIHYGFIEGINGLVGTEDYSVRVYAGRTEQEIGS